VVAISFVGFADFRNVMTEEIETTHHLAESREQFVKELRLAMEGLMAFTVSPSNRQSNVPLEHRGLQLRALSALPQCSSV
jgi:hypothetical protein